MKKLLLVCHCPSSNTLAMRDALVRGASDPDIDGVDVRCLAPADTQPEDVLWADALILGTTENFGYMAGLVKDFFERIYYPCLEQKQGLPFVMYIRAGMDGTGTRLSIEKIVTGLKWKTIQPPLLCRGDYQPEFIDQCHELGMTVAAGLEAGVF